MLRIVSKVLDTAGVPWFVASGTLLGTYRHGGMIPWDDDVDIMIPLEYSDTVRQLDWKAEGLLYSRGCLACWSDYYAKVCRYLNARYHDLSLSKCKPSRYFGALKFVDTAHSGNTHVDVFYIIPVAQEDGTVAYSLDGGYNLIDQQEYEDFFPSRRGQFHHLAVPVPNNTHTVLCRKYGDLRIPKHPERDRDLLKFAEVSGKGKRPSIPAVDDTSTWGTWFVQQVKATLDIE